MSWTEIGAIGELIGAIGLFISICFVAYEMRLRRKDEAARELEVIQTRAIELQSGVAYQPELNQALTKWHRFTEGHFKSLPNDVDKDILRAEFTDEEWNLLGHHFSAQAYWVDIFLSKIDRYAVSEEALKTYDSMLQAFTTYLCQFGDITIPFRAKKRYLSAEFF